MLKTTNTKVQFAIPDRIAKIARTEVPQRKAYRPFPPGG